KRSPPFALEIEQIAKPARASPKTVWLTPDVRVTNDMALSLLWKYRNSCHVRLGIIVPPPLRRFGVNWRINLAQVTELPPLAHVGARAPGSGKGAVAGNVDF